MSDEYKHHQSFPLRLSPYLRSQAIELAKNEGLSLNHFISLAVTEKVTRMEEAHRQSIQRVNGESHEFVGQLAKAPTGTDR